MKEDVKLSNQILEPLPLIQRHQIQVGSEEKDVLYKRYQGFQGNKNRVGNNKHDKQVESDDSDYFSDLDQPDDVKEGEDKPKCRHKEIINYKCTKCDYQVHNFKSYFDSGDIHTYIRVLFLSETEDIMKSIYNLPSHQGFESLPKSKQPQLIFQCYRPTNVLQMREYILYLIHKSLLKKLKHSPQEYSQIKRLMDINYHQSNASNPRQTHKFKQYLKHFQQQKQKIMFGQGESLFFDSLFESGNLECAYSDPSQEHFYNLFMNADSNTRGHQQWFYFRVRNIKANQKYTLVIRNFTKGQSLYKKGMKIMWKSKSQMKQQKSQMLFSEQEQIPFHFGWEQVPDQYISDLSYFKSDCERSHIVRGLYKRYFKEDGDDTIKDDQSIDLQTKKGSGKYYNCLKFTIQFPYDKDSVSLAYSRPFEYSQQLINLVKIENNLHYFETRPDINQEINYQETVHIQSANIIYTRQVLCLTISGMPVPVLTITGPSSSDRKPLSKRQAIFISARVHPGETNSSFVCDGFLNFLTNTNPQSKDFAIANQLRDNFVFKIVPCLNPDGVACGNYRTSLAGVDLNRQWIYPHQQLHPTIYSLKGHMDVVSKDREILLYCDMHGHSKKKNAFIYACNSAANGGFQSWTKVRLFPRLLAKNSFRFNLNDCTFKVEKSKLATARVVVWKEFSVTNSFTLENSFFGYDYGPDGEIKEFKAVDYSELGCEIARSIWEYKELCAQIQKELNLTKGWLKPKLLLQITGTPAAERIKEEINQLKKQRLKSIIQPQQSITAITNSQQLPIGKQKTIQNQNSFSLKTQNSAQIPQSSLPQRRNAVRQLSETQKLQAIIKIQRFLRKIKAKREANSDEVLFETMQTVDPDRILESIDKRNEESDNLTIPLRQSQNLQQKHKINQLNSFGQFKLKSPLKNHQDIESSNFQDSPNEFIATPSAQSNQDSTLGGISYSLNLTKMSVDWREYFSVEELERAYNLILQGQEPDVDMGDPDDQGSDSCPSEDNLDIKELYEVIYVRKKWKRREIDDRFQKEQEYLKKFEKYVKKQIKQIKRQGSQGKESPTNLNNQSLESIEQTSPIMTSNPQNVKANLNLRIRKSPVAVGSNKDDKFSKIKLVMRSRSKEQLNQNSKETAGSKDGNLVIQQDDMRQMNKQNRSLGQDDQSSVGNESITNLNDNLFMQGAFGKEINSKDKNQTLNSNPYKNLQSGNQRRQSNFPGQNENQMNQQLKMLDQERRLKSLEQERPQSNQSSLNPSTQNQDYSTFDNRGLNQQLNYQNHQVYLSQAFTSQDKRLNSQDGMKGQRQSIMQQKKQNQIDKFNNLVPQQTQSKTVFMNNQYPLLPLLQMEGTNVQKNNQTIQNHQAQEQQIINKDSQVFMKDFTDIQIEASRRKNQFQAQLQQMQRPQTNQMQANMTQGQFFNKRLLKSLSPNQQNREAHLNQLNSSRINKQSAVDNSLNQNLNLPQAKSQMRFQNDNKQLNQSVSIAQNINYQSLANINPPAQEQNLNDYNTGGGLPHENSKMQRPNTQQKHHSFIQNNYSNNQSTLLSSQQSQTLASGKNSMNMIHNDNQRNLLQNYIQQNQQAPLGMIQKNAPINNGVQKQSFRLQNLIPEVGIQQYNQIQQCKQMGLSTGFNNFKQSANPSSQQNLIQKKSFLIQGNNKQNLDSSVSQKQVEDIQNQLSINQKSSMHFKHLSPAPGVNTKFQADQISHSSINIKNRKLNSLSPSSSIRIPTTALGQNMNQSIIMQPSHSQISQPSVSEMDKINNINLLENLRSEEDEIEREAFLNEHRNEINQICNEMMLIRQNYQYNTKPVQQSTNSNQKNLNYSNVHLKNQSALGNSKHLSVNGSNGSFLKGSPVTFQRK